MSRRKARECAFKVLFQVDQVTAEPRQALDYLLQESGLAEREQDFSWQLIEGALEHRNDIDGKIASFSRDWSINRMPAVDRNIMRIAAYEIMYMDHSHPVVAIDEAVEMAKKYGDENSAGFINAILDRILSEST